MKWILFFSIVFVACKQHTPPEDPGAWKKIKMDFRRFDSDGLAGPDGNKISADYEFCIPMSDKYLAEVKKIDPTAKRSGGKGRVGCNEKEWMIIGSTHQQHFQRVIFRLASLQYVREIQETFYE